MTFRVGQKVCCIDAALRPRAYHQTKLEEGAVYTVSGFARRNPVADVVGIYLVGINSLRPGMSEDWGYHPNRFRPVDEQKRELPAVITALLRLRQPHK